MDTMERELSVKDLLLSIRASMIFLKGNWKLLLISSLLAGAFGGGYAKFIAPAKYTADLSFVLANDSKSGSLGALVGSFGFDLGGAGEGAFSGENIIQLLQSRKMVERAVMRIIPNEKTMLLDEIIKERFLKKWETRERLKKQLPFPNSSTKFSPIQDSLFSVIHGYVVLRYLTVVRVDKKLSFYKVSTSSPSEKISSNLTKNLVEEAASFYIETKTKQARKNLLMLEKEADSLRAVLGGNVGFIAQQSDQLYNLNPSIQKERVPQQISQLQVQALGLAYGEVIKNLELAKITLQKETPLYQIIDAPPSKLANKRVSVMVFSLAFAIGCFVGISAWLIVKRYVQNISLS